MKKLLLVFCVSTLLGACGVICFNESPSFQRRDFTGNNLRIDGYFYGDTTSDYENTLFVKFLVFYKNGMISLPGGADINKINEQYELLCQNNLSYKYYWGIFKTDKDLLSTENSSINLPLGCSKIEKRTFVILNDTTIKVTSFQSDGNVKLKNSIYRFRKHILKPDSTNFNF